MTIVGRCPLCHQDCELQDSHLLPNAIYRDLRMPELPNPNPIMSTSVQTGPRQEQVKTPLLCGSCEQRFNRGGENWVLANGYRLNGPSRLYEILQQATPLPEHQSGTVYAGGTIPGLDMRQISYFGVSVFWRASLSVWSYPEFGERSTFVDLGPYGESLRTYLLGESDLPRDIILWAAVFRTPTPPPVMSFPAGHRLPEGYYQHNFDIPGLSFTLFVGKQIPQKIRELCGIRSNIIFFTPIQTITEQRTAELFRKSPPSPALRKMHKKIWNEEL
jgi:hypothetical protein